jgi:hypothetical protein
MVPVVPDCQKYAVLCLIDNSYKLYLLLKTGHPWNERSVECYCKEHWTKITKFDKCELLFAFLHFDVNCIKLCSKCLKIKYKKGIFILLN